MELTRLLNDGVLVRLMKPSEKPGLIWIPPSAERDPADVFQGIVEKVGPGRLRKKDGMRILPEVRVGDRVVFYWAAGKMDDVYSDERGEFQILNESSIQAVLEP